MNVDPNSVGTNSTNYSNVVKQSQLPVMLDLVDGTFKVKGDREGFKMGFLEAKGTTPQELMTDIASKAKTIRTETKRAKRLSDNARSAYYRTIGDKKDLKNSRVQLATLKKNSATRRAQIQAKLQAQIKAKQAVLEHAKAEGVNTSVLSAQIAKMQANLQSNTNTRLKAISDLESERESKFKTLITESANRKKAAANAKAAANKVKKPSAIGRLFGWTRRSLRKSKRQSRRHH